MSEAMPRNEPSSFGFWLRCHPFADWVLRCLRLVASDKATPATTTQHTYTVAYCTLAVRISLQPACTPLSR